MTIEFDQELSLLRYDTLNMFQAVRGSIDKALQALKLRDGSLSQEVMDADEDIDIRECRTEAQSLRLLALKQPVARDLRNIIATMRIASNLERIGDEAVNIVDRNVILLERQPIESVDGLWEMGGLALEIFDKAAHAYAEGSLDLCEEVRASVMRSSALHHKVFKELTEIMIRHSASVEQAEQLAFISYSLKRICDRCSNISESVIFIVQGVDVKHKACLGAR